MDEEKLWWKPGSLSKDGSGAVAPAQFHLETELQKRADRADQSVLFFLAGANFWEKHAKNCAILCIFVYFLCIFWC